MKTSASNMKIREIVTGIQNGSILPRPEFQRRLVWSSRDKNNFIDTILGGFPFPEIYLADGDVDLDTGAGARLLVDGQQRVNTIFEYFSASDELKLSGAISPYSGLSEEQKRAFLNYDVAVRDLGAVSKDQIIEVFRRINATSYALNDMEINNAVYAGPFKSFAEHIAELPFFEERRFFRPLQIKRMGDVRYILSILITMIHGYFNRDDELEEYLNRFNDEFPLHKEMDHRTKAVLDVINRLRLSERSRAWKQGDFFTLFVELDAIINKEGKRLDVATLRESLEKFYSLVDTEADGSGLDDVRQYYAAVLQAANDRGNRRKRGEIVRKVIEGFSLS